MDKIQKPLLLLLLVLALFLMYLTQPASAAEYPAWSGAGVAYAIGDIVTYSGSYYSCTQAHTSNAGWNPATATTLWKKIAEPTPTPEPTPDPTSTPTSTPEPTPEPTSTPTSTPEPTPEPTPLPQESPLPSVPSEPLPDDSESYVVLFMGVLAGLIMALIWAWSARRL